MNWQGKSKKGAEKLKKKTHMKHEKEGFIRIIGKDKNKNT